MCSPDGPDTSKQDAIAAKVQQMNEDQFNWVKQQYEADAPNRAAATEMSQKVGNAQLAQMDRAAALGEESANDYRRVYRPLEEAAAKDAVTYTSDARMNDEAGKAVAGVNQQADIMRGAAERNLASMGVNPSDGAWANADAELRNQQVLQGAQAANAARDRVQTVGRALRSDAIATGRGVVGTQGTQAGLTLTAGNSAVGSSLVPSQITQGGVGMVQQAAGQASSGLMGSANIYQNSSNMAAQASGDKSSATAGLAGAAMTAAAVF